MQHSLTAAAKTRRFQKSDEPSCAGRIDCTAWVSDVRGMSFRVFISSWSRAFTCIAFALALVLSPPSAAHAASGMHDGHQAKSIVVVGAAMTHDTGSDAHHAHEKLRSQATSQRPTRMAKSNNPKSVATVSVFLSSSSKTPRSKQSRLVQVNMSFSTVKRIRWKQQGSCGPLDS